VGQQFQVEATLLCPAQEISASPEVLQQIFALVWQTLPQILPAVWQCLL